MYYVRYIMKFVFWFTSNKINDSFEPTFKSKRNWSLRSMNVRWNLCIRFKTSSRHRELIALNKIFLERKHFVRFSIRPIDLRYVRDVSKIISFEVLKNMFLVLIIVHSLSTVFIFSLSFRNSFSRSKRFGIRNVLIRKFPSRVPTAVCRHKLFKYYKH